MAVTTSQLADILLIVALLLTAIVLEHRYGLRKRASFLWHKLVNAETHFAVTATYETDIDADHLQDELKTVFRERYGSIDVLEDADDFTVNVDETFLVTLTTDDDTATIATNKITSTMRDIRPEFGALLAAVAAIADRARQIADDDTTFADDTFTAELFLPYDSTFINIHLPRGVTLDGYQLDLEYPEYDCTIQDTGDSLTVSTDHRADLETILDRLLRIWAVWWKRVEHAL